MGKTPSKTPAKTKSTKQRRAVVFDDDDDDFEASSKTPVKPVPNVKQTRARTRAQSKAVRNQPGNGESSSQVGFG